MILDVLNLIGRATWEPFWVPVIAWTALAVPPYLALKRADLVHPRAEYRLSQVLLAALPISLLAGALTEVLPGSMAVASAHDLAVTVLPPVEAPSVSPSVAPTWQWTQAVGLLTVGAGAAALVGLAHLALDIVATLRVRHSLSGSIETSIQALATRTARRLGTSRPFRVCLTSKVAVPLTLGGFRPMILLPVDLADDAKALRMTLAHECIHVRRYDDLAHLLERIVAALFVAHPLVGRLQQYVAEAREQACDVTVLQNDEHAPADYARLLLAFADGTRRQRLDTLSLSESPSSLTNRLRAMHSSVSSWLSSRLGLGITLLSVGLFLTLGVIACSDSVAPSSSNTTSAPDAATKQKTADDVYTEVAQKPDCGGVQALAEKIHYPELAQKAGIEGQVFVQFIVDKTGAVVEPTIQKGGHEMLNKAALSAVKRLECTPGRQEDDPVKVQMTVPVTFRLDDEPENGSAGSSESAGTSSETPKNDAGGRLFEKAGIQMVRVLINEKGDLLIDGDLVEMTNLTDAVRQRIKQDAARAALLYADGAPTDRVDAAEATLRALDLQHVHVQKVE